MKLFHSITGVLILLAALAALAGCGGQEEGQADREAQSPAEQAVALDKGPRAIEILTLDTAKAERGAVLFEEKSCTDCHTLGEADLSPDLAGVLERRTLPWLVKQITDPAWMNEHDPVTRTLIEEFDLEMAGPEVTADEAEAVLHYLLRESGAGAD